MEGGRGSVSGWDAMVGTRVESSDGGSGGGKGFGSRRGSGVEVGGGSVSGCCGVLGILVVWDC